jgi:serine protease Do
MFPEDELNGSNRSDQNSPAENRELPPVQPRYEDDIKRETNYNSEYDDSYNYADSKRTKKVKKEKGQRSMAGIMAALCVASAVGGSLLTGYVVMPAVAGGYSLAAKSTPSASPTVVSSAVPDQSEEIGGAAPVISDKSNPVPEIAQKVTPSVVGVTTYNKQFVPGEAAQTQDIGYGSGFVISSDGYIVTNSHVVEEGDYVKVALHDGTEYDATVKGRDYDSDVAVLKIEATGLTPVAIGNSDNLKVGEMAIAIGNPLGEELAGTVTVGYISSLNRQIQSGNRTYNVLQTDAAINPGNSGGPLLNVNGEVIGVNTLKSMFAGVDQYGETIASEGIGFAMPVNYVIDIAQKLIQNGSIEKPGVGISYYMMTDEDAANWGVPKGALVAAVTENGPAFKAGVKQNDIITAVDGVAIDQIENLADTIKGKGVDTTVTVTVWRNGKSMDIPIVTEDINKLNNDNTTSESDSNSNDGNPFSQNPDSEGGLFPFER